MNHNFGEKSFTKIRLIFWTITSLFAGVLLVSLVLFVLNKINFIKIPELENTQASTLQSTEEKEQKKDEEQKYFYLNKDSDGPKVSAKSYLVGDLDTGEIILSKNQDKILPIASVSKLMTALLVTEIINPGNNVTNASRRALATYGGNGNFRVGEKIEINELLYPLLLESSNDAAEILAEHFGRETFIGKMNEGAGKLTMTDTVYEDPSGLSANNKSTTFDLFKLVGYLNKTKQEILDVTTKRSYSNKNHNWSNTSKFLHENGYTGGKSGYTDPAKETLISTFSLPLSEWSNRPIAIILLHSLDRYKDVKNILQYLKKNIYYGGVADTNTDWIKEKFNIPIIKDPDFITLTFAGDIMLDRGVRSSVVKNFNNDYSALFEKLESLKLKDSDIFFANLEGTASDQGADMHNLYSFRMDPGVIPALAGAGIDVLSLANNHVGDWGREAYTDTLTRLTENQILYTGGGINNTEAETPQIIEKYGMKIGFLGFSDVGPNWMQATENEAGILLASNLRFGEIIQNAAKQVDHLIVSFHFGDEYKTIHNERQEYLAHKAIDNGAKIVIGHHPHVVEDTEVYKGGYIAYSLGNFIFDQAFSTETMQGLLLNVKLWRDGNMTIRKDTVKLNRAFQPDTVIKGKEEKVVFE